MKDNHRLSASIYQRPYPWLFAAMAPGVIGTIVTLLPWAFAGLLLVVPGLSGLLGLTGLFFAWAGLMWPRMVSRRGPLVFSLLLFSWPAALFGLWLFWQPSSANETYQANWLRGLNFSSATFGMMALFFMWALCRWRLSRRRQIVKSDGIFKASGLLVASVSWIVPAGHLLALCGYGAHLRAQYTDQTRTIATQTIQLANQYRASHAGHLPDSNKDIGLTDPQAWHLGPVESVRIDHGVVTLTYRHNLVSELFGASTRGIVLKLEPAQAGTTPAIAPDGAPWTCKVAGMGNNESLVLLDGLCEKVFDL